MAALRVGLEAISGSPITSSNRVRARYLRLAFPEDIKGSDIGIFDAGRILTHFPPFGAN